MPRFLYRYMELLGYMGAGTPEDPGSDFSMSVWVDAADEEEARRWGRVVLQDYVRARYQPSGDEVTPEAYEGEIVKDECWLQSAAQAGYPVCRVGELPKWVEPWKRDNATVQRPPAREVPLAELISGATLEKLRAFLRTADRASGSSYPSNFDRWCAFLTEAHRQQAGFSGMQLERWLTEVEGWPEDTARALGHEYSAARALLIFYDDERATGPT